MYIYRSIYTYTHIYTYVNIYSYITAKINSDNVNDKNDVGNSNERK